jgi:hypothetical protein
MPDALRPGHLRSLNVSRPPYSLREGFFGSKSAQVCRVRVNSRNQLIQDSQRASDPQDVLEAGALAALDPHNCVPGDVGAVGDLGCGQAPKAAPRGQVRADPAHAIGDGQWCVDSGHAGPKVELLRH